MGKPRAWSGKQTQKILEVEVDPALLCKGLSGTLGPVAGTEQERDPRANPSFQMAPINPRCDFSCLGHVPQLSSLNVIAALETHAQT